MDRTSLEPQGQKGGFLFMESSAPPDNQDPLSAGDLFSGINANLIERSGCS
jgi:hypothetical protein